MEQTETSQPSLYNHAAKFGGIMGACGIVLVVLAYVVDIGFLGSLKFIGLILVLGIGITIYGGISHRNEIGGYMPFGKAYIYGALALAVSGAISTIFNMVLYQMIDPELPQKLTEAIIENTESTMRNWGAPEASIEPALAKMRDEMPGNFTYGGLAFGYVKALPWYLGIALITGLFIRKSVPVEL